jgi:hypothetical protein
MNNMPTRKLMMNVFIERYFILFNIIYYTNDENEND